MHAISIYIYIIIINYNKNLLFSLVTDLQYIDMLQKFCEIEFKIARKFKIIKQARIQITIQSN